jgi:hypothetical protein
MNEFEKEIAKKAAELTKEVAGDILHPMSKSISENLGLMVDGVMGWLGCWGEKQKIKQKIYIEEFKKEISLKISEIPQEYLIEPAVSIAGPVIETSKYYYEETHYREMFSNLLASACDKRYIHAIHPSFIEILKQFAPLDAKLLSMFKYHGSYPLADVQANNEDGSITPFIHSLFDFKDRQNEFSSEEYNNLTSSLVNLIRLGILNKNRDIIELGYNYDLLKNDFMYQYYNIGKGKLNNLSINRARIELTELGRKFMSCCLPNKDEV